MTTAKSRRSGTTAGSRERTRHKAAGRAGEAIPVLIRLPRLAEETEPVEANRADADQAEIRATIPITVRAPEPELLPPVPDAGGTAAVPPPPERRKESTQWIPSLASRNSPWLRFRFPRWAVRGGLAAGLIAVLALALSAIWDSAPDQDSDQMAGVEAADVMALPGIPTAEMPPVPLSLISPATQGRSEPSAPLVKVGPTADAAPSGPVANLANVRTADQRSASPSENADPLVVAASMQHAPPPGPALPAEPPASPTPPVSATAEAPPTVVGPNPAEANPAQQNAPQANPADAIANEPDLPLTGASAAAEASRPTERHIYPETNPATFQYPADYHLRLRNRNGTAAGPGDGTQSGGPQFNGPQFNGPQFNRPTTNAAAGGWQPNTARLQPRIEPPPVR